MHYEKFADGNVKCIEDEIPFELPEGWVWLRLQSFVDFIGGSQPPKATFEYTPNENNIRLIQIRDYKTDKFITYIPRSKARRFCTKDDVMIGRYGPPIFQILRGLEGSYNVALMKAVADSTLMLNDYLYYLLQDGELLRMLESLSDRTCGQDGINMYELNRYIVGIPPIHEQERIINYLIDILPKVDAMTQSKDELIELISAAKSKILDLAIRGQLVPQNPDDESASVLLTRIREEKEELIKQGKIKRDKKESIIFRGEDNSYYEKIGKSVSKIDDEIPFTLPDRWEWCRLGSLCSSIQYGLSNSAKSSGTHKLLRITDIQNGSVNWETVPYTTTEDPKTYILKSEDIVFARTGATVGKSFLIDQLPYESVYASFLIRIRLLKFISPQYIYNFFNSPCYWEQISNKAVGVGQPNCNGTSLSNLFIPIPPVKVQDEIVSLITKL